MKRSEMINKIDDFLIEKGVRKSGSFDFASDILTLIEQAGMKPNSFCYYATDEYDNIKNVLDAHEVDGGIQWEPEND